MFFRCVELYALVMLVWPIIAVIYRGSRTKALIIIASIIAPLLCLGMEILMALCVVDADEVRGAALYMPTMALIVYFLGSLGILRWAYRGERYIDPTSIKIEPVKSFPLPDRKSV